MGNAKSTSCSNKTSVEEQDLNLTEYDMTIYEHRKEKIFKGTIAICVIYVLIALLFIISSYFAPSIKFVIFDKFLPFTIVFIIGTILLIIYLFSNILKFNPIKINKNYDYTNISCPDYWKLEYDDNLKNYFDSNTINTHIFNYRCVLDSNIISKTDLYFNRKNQLGVADITGSTAIGMTGSAYNKLNTYNSINKDSIDSDNTKYIVADIKDTENKKIVDKITGTFDSNVYKNLVESSLLMNNYIFDSNASIGNEWNKYRHISHITNSNAKNYGFSENIIDINTSAKRNELKLQVVNSDIKNTTGTNPISVNAHTINIKKNIVQDGSGTSSEYLDDANIKYDSNGNEVNLEKIPLVCNRVYPLLLAAKDKELSKKSSGKYDENILRCAYSKMCGVPWSDMNCDKYEI